MVKHNNQVPNGHFKKHWQRRVRTWFNQPKQKIRRRTLRHKKALHNAPRPVAGLLRPIVQCSTTRYNMKQRAGKGFTLEELRKAGIERRAARNIGISVDFRRRNKNEEHLQRNVDRLKEYKSKLILFPRNAKKPKKGDATAEQLKNASQNTAPFLLPFPSHPQHGQVLSEVKALTDDEKNPKKSVVARLRRARMAQRLEARRKIRLAKKKERLEMEKKLEASGKDKGKDKKGKKEED